MIRTSARAIIFTHDSKVVLIHRKWRGEEYWVTPGGGVEEGESLHDALKREMREEIGIDVEIGDLILEVAKDVHERHSHQKFFLCTHVSGEIGSGTDKSITHSTPDNFSEVVSVTLEEAENLRIVPEEARTVILDRMKLL